MSPCTFENAIMSYRFFSALSLSLALSMACPVMAQDQQPPTVRKGTVKAHARYFNPFEVSRTRVSVDRFGVVHLANGLSFPPAAVQATKAAATSTASLVAAMAAPALPAAL